MRTTLFLLILTSLSLFAEDKQIAVFPSQGILSIDKNTNDRLALFTSYKNFDNASLFQKDDGTYYFIITYQLGSEIKKGKVFYDQDQLNLLREKFQSLKTKKQELRNFDNDGRLGLLLGSTSYGFFHGFFIPSGLGIDNANVATGSFFLILGGSYLVPYFATKNDNVTLAERDLSLGLGATGFAHGILLNYAFSNNFGNASFLAMSGFSIAEMIIGYKAVDKYNLSLAEARMAKYGSVYGLVSGGALLALIGTDIFGAQINTASLVPIATSMGAAIFAPRLADKFNLSGGDAEAFSSSLLLGYLFSANLLVHMEDASTEAIGATVLLSSIAGAYGGLLLGDSYTISDENMLYVDLITVGGGLMGAGLGFLVEADGNALLHAATIGSMAGFLISYMNLSEKGNNISIIERNELIDFSFQPENAFNNEFNLRTRLRTGNIHRPVLGLSLKLN